MKMNIKRAFKTMNKEGVGRSYYYRLPNSNVLVSNGHVITTVDNIQFEEYKDILKDLQVAFIQVFLGKNLMITAV